MAENNSVRSCEVMQYLEYLPGYPDWRTTLENNLNAHLNDDIRHFAYIVHDRDVDEKAISKEREKTGTDNVPVIYKKPHLHMILELRDGYKMSTIAGWFDIETRQVEKIKGKIKKGKRWFYDVGGALEYLCHENAPDKHQYSRDAIIKSEGYNIEKRIADSRLDREKMKSIDKLIARIEAGEVRPYEVADHISIDSYIECKRDIDAAFEYYNLRNRNPDRRMKTLYFTGEAGTGKSTLAEHIAKKLNKSYFISSSGKDIMDGYRQEEVLILDDFRPHTLTVDDFLKLTDPNINSLIGSRYKNKMLSAELLIITSILPLDKFYSKMKTKDEPFKQVQRRIAAIVEVEDEKIRFLSYDDNQNAHVLTGEMANPVPELYPKEKRKEDNSKTINKIMGLFEPYTPESESDENDGTGYVGTSPEDYSGVPS